MLKAYVCDAVNQCRLACVPLILYSKERQMSNKALFMKSNDTSIRQIMLLVV